MARAPKTSYELAMERLRASDPAGADERPLFAAQKEGKISPYFTRINAGITDPARNDFSCENGKLMP